METLDEEPLADRIARAIEVCEEYKQTWVAKLIHSILQPCPSCGAWDGCPGCIVPPEDSEDADKDRLAIKLLQTYAEVERLKEELVNRRGSAVTAAMRFLPAVMSELHGWHQELTTREQQLMDAAMVVHMRRVGYFNTQPR